MNPNTITFSVILYSEISNFELFRGSFDKCVEIYQDYTKKYKNTSKYLDFITTQNYPKTLDKKRIGGIGIEQYIVSPTNINHQAQSYTNDFLNRANNSTQQDSMYFPPGEILDGGLR